MLKTLLFASLSLSSVALAADEIRFVPDPYPIGVVEQGSTKHSVLKGANGTSKEIILENVIGQGIGMSNFKYPTKIGPNATVTIEFDMDFSGMDGEIQPVVVLVGNDGKPYTASLDGIVSAPIFFGEKMFDAGFYAPGEKREWTFYVWETGKKEYPDIELSPENSKEFSMKSQKVMLNVDKLDKIKEGKKGPGFTVPGIKVTLTTKGLFRQGFELKQRSIRKIVAFKSKKYPKATPEILIIGYWK